MMKHTIELQFRMNDVKNNNRDKGQHAHSDENGQKEGGKGTERLRKVRQFQNVSIHIEPNRCQYCRDRTKVEVDYTEQESESGGYDGM
jgi:hypothetical protein